MKNLLGVAFLLFALSTRAKADISDSGNLTIGCNGVIQGTMTVQGNAFSIGGATVSAAGSTLTLNVYAPGISSNGIQWAERLPPVILSP